MCPECKKKLPDENHRIDTFKLGNDIFSLVVCPTLINSAVHFKKKGNHNIFKIPELGKEVK